MNETLIKNTKKLLLQLLNQCTESQQFMFKRMYAHKDTSVDIDEAVTNMDSEKLNIAFSQVERTVNQNNERRIK